MFGNQHVKAIFVNFQGTDMRIVASTASRLEEPSQNYTLRTHDPLTFAFEEPSKQII